MRAAGGGGYGLAGDRPLEAIQGDLDDGYISATAAKELYGVKLKRDDNRTEGGWVVAGR